MSEKPIILGIETSCDETAVSLIQDNQNGTPKILSNIISSQFDIHKEFKPIHKKILVIHPGFLIFDNDKYKLTDFGISK